MHDDGDDDDKRFHLFSPMPLSLSISRHPRLPRRLSTSSPSPATSPSPVPPPASSTSTRTDPSFDDADSNLLEFGRRHDHNADNAGSKSSESSTAYDPSSHSVPLHSYSEQHLSSLPPRHRTSLLSAASGALGFRKKMGSVSRKKPNLHPLSSTSYVVPGVIEISARNNGTTVTSAVGGTTTHGDYEYEERERLRDVAAQSIGLDPELLHDLSKSDSQSCLDSRQSPSPQPPCIPPFPATLLALRPFTLLSSTLPKFTPPSSLLVYALAKQWKPRIIVLTSHSLSQKTHVHLFKGSSKDDKEIERLEVTENSVIFVAEEELGGRGSVVKLGGKDVSQKRSGASVEDNLHTMWFLQITDPVESQRWIASIKNAVLTQRAVRAGLHIPAHTNGGNEPKGDIDVMLSMHLQGLISAHPTKPSAPISFPSPSIPTSPSPPPSLHSLKINIPPSPSPTTTIKGIFSGTRSRSPSVDGSPTSTYPPGHAEDSFGVAGASLLTMLRTKSSADSSSSPSHSLPLPHPRVSGQGSPAPSLRSSNPPVVITASDLKISKERDTPEISTVVPEASSSSALPGSSTPPTSSVSPQGALTFSLQPPPRKCKHVPATIPTALVLERQGMYKQASGNRSVAGNFGISSGSTSDVTLRETSPPVSPCSSSVYSGRLSGSFSPDPGLEMQSLCIGEGDGGEQSDEVALTLSGDEIPNPLATPRGRTLPSDKLPHGTTITKRWSRQGIPLPKQLTPPSGPPPSIPSEPKNDPCTSVEPSASVPVTTDPSPANSFCSQSQGGLSPRSGPLLSPTFWKRASGSSTYSASSTNTSDSRSRSQIPITFSRESFPSSTRSIVCHGASPRPMSLLVHVSSHAGHVGTVKRRSMPPPRPAPSFAPPPAPVIQGSTSEPDSAPRKSFRSSVAQRALRLSLTSPKPPPSSALPPRPDEAVFAPGHRRSSSTGTADLHPISTPSSRPSSVLSRNSNSIDLAFPSPRSLSIRQRLRLLSTPPISPVQSPSHLTPSLRVSTLDLSDDNDDDDLPTPGFRFSHPFGLGEHIMTIPDDPSFLQLSNPVSSNTPKPPRSHLRSIPPSSSMVSGLRTPPLEPDRDFIALSPPPPRRDSKPHIVTMRRPEVEKPVHQEESKLGLSQRSSVISLGFVTTS